MDFGEISNQIGNFLGGNIHWVTTIIAVLLLVKALQSTAGPIKDLLKFGWSISKPLRMAGMWSLSKINPFDNATARHERVLKFIIQETAANLRAKDNEQALDKLYSNKDIKRLLG